MHAPSLSVIWELTMMPLLSTLFYDSEIYETQEILRAERDENNLASQETQIMKFLPGFNGSRVPVRRKRT